MSPAHPDSNIYAMPHGRAAGLRWLSRVAAALLIGGAACERAETRPAAVATAPPGDAAIAPAAAAIPDEALVRVVHAIPFGSPMDVYAGDTLAFNGVRFKSMTGYRALDGRRYVFSLRPAGITSAGPLASVTESVDNGRYYSVFALPADNGRVRLRVVADPLDRPSNGQARLRVVHAGDGLDLVDITASGSDRPLLGAVAFQAVTGYQDVDPLTGALEVRAGGTAALLMPYVHLESGRFYSMVIVGRARGSPPLEAFIIEDRHAPPIAAR